METTMETYIHEVTLEETLVSENLEETIIYNCDKCPNVFSSLKELEIHQNTKSPRTLHTCQICLFASCSTNELNQHYLNTHTDLNYRGKKNIHEVVNNPSCHQFQSTHIHEDFGRLSIGGSNDDDESLKIHSENDNGPITSNAKNDIISGSILKAEDIKVEPLDLGRSTTAIIKAENIKTEPIQNNEDSTITYEEKVELDKKIFETKSNNLQRLKTTTTTDLLTLRKHKRNKQGSTIEIIKWGKPWGFVSDILQPLSFWCQNSNSQRLSDKIQLKLATGENGEDYRMCTFCQRVFHPQDTQKYVDDHNKICQNIVTFLEPNPIYAATTFGHLQLVKFFASNVENPNAPMDDGWTPIHKAAAENHVEIFKFLASRVKNPNLPLPDGRTPFQIAAQKNHIEIVKFFIQMYDQNTLAKMITQMVV